MPKPAAPARKPPEPKDVAVGDELYVHLCGQPHTCRVVAHGRHGVTGEIEGANHRFTWDKVLGHKKRKMLRYAVADQGEDGMILEDRAGNRRFVATPNEAKEDPMVAKAFGSRPVALLVKADGMAPRAGLAKKQITDKTGRRQTKWVRVNQDAPKERARAAPDEAAKPKPPHSVGDQVEFAAGDFKGAGTVVGEPGADGAHVKDASGRVHQVRWSEVTGKSATPEDETAVAAHAQGKDPESIAQSLFSPEAVDKLPKRALQPMKTWEDLAAAAPEGLQQFTEIMGKIGQSMGLTQGRKLDSLSDADWSSPEGFVFIGGLKSEKRAREKAEADYEGDYSKLCDVVRGTIAVASLDDVQKAVNQLHGAGLELAQQPKNRMAKPTDTGYRDLLMVVKLPNGMMAELQVNLKSMQRAKSGDGHHEYEVTRSLQAKHGEDAPSESWPPEDHTEFYRALKAQKDLYGAAWKDATGGGQAAAGAPQAGGEKKLIKSDHPGMLLVWKR